MADADIARLIDTYRYSNTNLINYIKFQQDLEKLPAQGKWRGGEGGGGRGEGGGRGQQMETAWPR